MRKLSLFILFFCLSSVLVAQKNNSADKLFQDGNYSQAMEKYAILLKSNPSHPQTIFRYARCAQELGDITTAMEYYNKLPESYSSKFYYMAEIYMQKWHADAAIEAYNKYLSMQDKETGKEEHIAKQVALAEKLQRYLRRVERIHVLDSIMIPMDSIQANLKFSVEAGLLQYDSVMGLCYTNQRGDYRIWSQMVDSVPMLCSSHQLLDTWTEMEVLPENVNFANEQYSPYLLGDGVTLYFSANAPEGIGGLDIYVSRYNVATEMYTDPDNIGFPYNSTANEYWLIMDESQQKGYLATDRFAPEGFIHVYTFVIPQQKHYWRGLGADELANYAQLKVWDVLPSDDTEEVIDTTMNEIVDWLPSDSISVDFRFVLNDSVVYTRTTDFRSDEAYVKFVEWEEYQLKWRNDSIKLDGLRKQYMEADELTRQNLMPMIMELESHLRTSNYKGDELLLTIRRLETSAIETRK